jgi:ABC-type phosphate/phosphonate transport system permease subunit
LVFFGFAAALIPFVADVLEPVMMLLNAIPRVIMAPLFVIWLGIELPSKVALAIVLVAVLIFFAVYSGIKDVNQLLVDRVRTLGGGRMILLREVYIPSVTAVSKWLSVLLLRAPSLGSLLQRLEVSVTCSSLPRALITQRLPWGSYFSSWPSS